MPSLVMAVSNKIIDLRNLLAKRFPCPPSPAATSLTTKLLFLDEVLGGGFPQGAMIELISPECSAGSASLIHALLHCAQRDLYFLALIDGRDSFDPSAFGAGNAALHHLLWVRCSKAFEAIKATDLLLRDGNFPLVIVDLVLNPPVELRNIRQTSWYRLQRLVQATSTACLIMTRQSMVSSAQFKIVLENSWMLSTFDQPNAILGMRFRRQRFHLRREVGIGDQTLG
jgi:recA bacterial DNA recombination protein